MLQGKGGTLCVCMHRGRKVIELNRTAPPTRFKFSCVVSVVKFGTHRQRSELTPGCASGDLIRARTFTRICSLSIASHRTRQDYVGGDLDTVWYVVIFRAGWSYFLKTLILRTHALVVCACTQRLRKNRLDSMALRKVGPGT